MYNTILLKPYKTTGKWVGEEVLSLYVVSQLLIGIQGIIIAHAEMNIIIKLYSSFYAVFNGQNIILLKNFMSMSFNIKVLKTL